MELVSICLMALGFLFERRATTTDKRPAGL